MKPRSSILLLLLCVAACSPPPATALPGDTGSEGGELPNVPISEGRQASPPDASTWYHDNERPLPVQFRWQVRPYSGFAWDEIFAFKPPSSLLADNADRARWLNLHTADEELLPSLFDTSSGQVITLAPSARRFCDPAWRVVRLVEMNIGTEGLPQPVTWLDQRRADGTLRTSASYVGQLNTHGHWVTSPTTWVDDRHEGPLPIDCEAMSFGPPGEPIAFSPAGQDVREPSPFRLESVMWQPVLRDARGRARTPELERDIATVQWKYLLTHIGGIPEGSEGYGLIDGRGRMVIPFMFGELKPVTARRRIQLCLPVSNPHRGEKPICAWQALHGTGANPPLRPVQQDNRWGYQDAQGRWVIAPQFFQAAPFRNGYAVVVGEIPFTTQTSGWHPPAWPPERPHMTKIWRAGRFWVVHALLRGQSRVALMNDDGQWLIPKREPALEILVPFGKGGRAGYLAELLSDGLPDLLGRAVRVSYHPQASEQDYEGWAESDTDTQQVLLAAVRLPRSGVASVHGPERIAQALQKMQPVSTLGSQPLALAMNADKAHALGIHDTRDMLVYACKHPGTLSIATGADGWTGQLAFQLLRDASKTDIRRVTVAGADPGSDAITKDGIADMLLTPINRLATAVARDQLLMLGTTAATDHPQTVNGVQWPTLSSTLALDGYAVYDHYSLWSSTSLTEQDRLELQRAIAQLLAQPAIANDLKRHQMVAGGGTPDELLALEENEAALWQRALREPERQTSKSSCRF